MKSFGTMKDKDLNQSTRIMKVEIYQSDIFNKEEKEIRMPQHSEAYKRVMEKCQITNERRAMSKPRDIPFLKSRIFNLPEDGKSAGKKAFQPH